MSRPTFHIRIAYREPTYERYRGGPRPEPYYWIYRVEAHDLAGAKRLALEEFRSLAKHSGVAWGREVVAVEPVGPHACGRKRAG